MAALEDLRAKTAELLDEGLNTGALTREEHSWRTNHLARAESVGAMESLVEDLLGGERSVSVLRSNASQMTLMASRSFGVADLGRRTDLVTLMGSSVVNLRDLGIGQELTVELVTVMGDTVVEVPAGVRVRVECTPIMADCHVAPEVQSPEGTVRLTGAIIMGSLRVVPAKKPR